MERRQKGLPCSVLVHLVETIDVYEQRAAIGAVAVQIYTIIIRQKGEALHGLPRSSLKFVRAYHFGSSIKTQIHTSVYTRGYFYRCKPTFVFDNAPKIQWNRLSVKRAHQCDHHTRLNDKQLQ